jgi:hypothetical protein
MVLQQVSACKTGQLYSQSYAEFMSHPKSASDNMYVCMYVCTWGGPEIRPLHRDVQWSIVRPLLINPLLILHFEWSVGLYLWGRHNSHYAP